MASLFNKDKNNNGIPDKLERRNANDMNGNRIPDKVEGLWNKDINKNGIPDKLERNGGTFNNDRNFNGIPDNLEQRSSTWNDRNGNGIPDNLEQRSSTWNDRNGNGIPDNLEGRGNFTGYRTTTTPIVQQVVLPTQIVEKPLAVHEEIRREQVEEIQPVVNVEKLKTEIHQVTQPLFDKEVKAVNVSKTVLASQVLPEVHLPGSGFAAKGEFSTVNYRDTATMTIEKPAIFVETEKKQIIEEIQPVLYKETIIPTVIQETKPIYQKIVEGPTYVQEVLPAKNLSGSKYTTFVSGTTTSGLSTDFNGNGIPDSLEQRTQQWNLNDRNFNGIPDNLEQRNSATFTTHGMQNWNMNDRNNNGIPDNLERRNTNDMNGNGIPDTFERRSNFTGTGMNPNDVNGNKIPDSVERLWNKDINGNGINDKYEQANRMNAPISQQRPL